MKTGPVIVCNPGYGNGPLLRCTEVARAWNRLRAERGGTSCRIVVPADATGRSGRILAEETGSDPSIVYDATFAGLRSRVNHPGGPFTGFLRAWTGGMDAASADAREHLRSTYGPDLYEIARVPLLDLNIERVAGVTFGRVSELWDRAALADGDHAPLWKGAADHMRKLENRWQAHIVTLPSTVDPRTGDTAVPPTMSRPHAPEHLSDGPGIYVSVSGIPESEKLVAFARTLNLTVYANHAEHIAGAVAAPPSIIAHPDIRWHIARPGWGAAWMSLLTGTPLLMPEPHPEDDPEIPLNTRRIATDGYGAVFDGRLPPEDTQRAMVQAAKTTREGLQRRFGTLEGAALAAKALEKTWTNH